MKPLRIALLLLTVPFATSALAQAPGQVDLEPVKKVFGTGPTVNLNFGSTMIQGLAEGFRGTNADIADLISGVSGLRVMVFEDVDGTQARAFVSDTAFELGNEGWTPAVEVRDDSDHVDIYIKESGEFVDGIVLMVTESSGDAVFINVFGALDPVFIGKTLGGGIDFSDFDLEELMNAGNGNGDDDS
ncbi:DUF4252 domain-containing protein [Halomonas denitrificans]|nr:DUF4252 domain-containing protein [Halomonas denitrificans]